MAISRQLNLLCDAAPAKSGKVTITIVNYSDPSTVNVGVGIYQGSTEIKPIEYHDIGPNSSLDYVFTEVPNGNLTVRIVGSYVEDLSFTLGCNITCTLEISSISAGNDVNGQSIGYIWVTATSAAGGVQYSLDYSNWNTTGHFDNLPAGTYDIYVKDAQACIKVEYDFVIEGEGCTLILDSFSKTDQVTAGANDGTATIEALTGMGPVQYKLDSGLWQASGSFTGIPVGAHTIYMRDAVNCTLEQAFTIVAVVVPPSTTAFVYVPIPNSLRFVPVTTVDNCAIFQTLDNTLFHDQYYPGYGKACYYQLVNKCDPLTIQWQSSYPNNSITITNTKTGAATVFPAAVVTLPPEYVLPTEYNIVEATMNFNVLPSGYYSVTMQGSGTGMPDYLFLGEPIHLHTSHKDTCMITYRNFDQQNEIEYLTGIVHRRRVKSRFFEPTYPSTRQVMTDNMGKTINLSSRVKRRIKLRTFYLPTYMHEQLAIAFALDELKVNGVRFCSEDDYSLAYLALYPLSNGEIDLTQVEFAINNVHDSGDIDSPAIGIIGVEGALLGY